MDYFQYLSETYEDFKGLDKEKILLKIKDPNNTILLINNIKNFIFDHGYVLNKDLVLNYLLYVHNFSKEVDNIIINEILEYFKLQDYKHIFENEVLSFKGFEFKLIENGIDLNQLLQDHDILSNNEYSTFFISFLSEYIFERLKKVIVVEKENIYALIEKNNILCNYNNFYFLKDESSGDCFLNTYNNLQISKKNFEKTLNTTNCFVLNDHINYCSVSQHYQQKTVNPFQFNLDVLYFHKNILTKEIIVDIIKDFQDYKNIIDEIIIKNKNQNGELYSPNQMFVLDNKVFQSLFKENDVEQLKNLEITYKNLFYCFNNIHKTSTIFINNDTNTIGNILHEKVLNKYNTTFIVLDIINLTYNLQLEPIIQIINKGLKNNFLSITGMPNASNLLFYVNIIFNFLKEINHYMFYTTLPLTNYSDLILKIFLDILFLDFEDYDFIYYKNQFVIYGTRRHAIKTFNEIYNILKSNNITICNVEMYDKIFDDKFNVFEQEFCFLDTPKKELFELKNNKYDFDNTKILFDVNDLII